MLWRHALGFARIIAHRNRTLPGKIGTVLVCMLVMLGPESVFAALTFSGDVSVNTGVPTAPIVVGREGIGTLQLDNGSSLTSSTTQFGVLNSGIGTGIVTGPRTLWTMNLADVGMAGIGRLEINQGAAADSTRLQIGVPTGHGEVVVDGPGSTLQVRGPLTVGSQNGFGQLKIADGAIVNSVQSTAIVGRSGRVLLDAGLLRMLTLTNDGLISGSGEVQFVSAATISQSGRLSAGAGDHLLMSGTAGTFQNMGIISADGGEIEILRPVNNSRQSPLAGGEVTLRNGTIRIGSGVPDGPQFTNTGLLVALGGENHFYGRVQTASTISSVTPEIAVTNDSVLVFHDDVTLLNGMMTVFAGSKATLLEDLMLTSGSQLMADISGSSIDTEYGEIEVVGNVQLGGQLVVPRALGFTPELGDSFPIIKSVGGITGKIALAQAPTLPNQLAWDLEIGPHEVVLNVVTALPGDYNTDGTVDAADFVQWRQSLGQTGAGLAADGNRNGVVDAADYDFWRSRFGNTLAAVGQLAQAAAVPEPGTVGIVGIAIVCAVSCWRVRNPK